MANNSESFATVEQITSRPNFSSTLVITAESFQSLIGKYHLSHSVKCQVKTENGICGQKHQVGYVGVDIDGKEGLIGGICGDKYFGEHTHYILERKRIDAEIDRRDNIEKLSNYKENFLTTSDSHSSLLKRIQEVKKKTDHLYNNFPDVILSYVYQAQRNQSWDLYVDVLKHTRGEKGMTSNWYIEKLCTFSPLPTSQEISTLLGRAENLQALFNEACSSDIENLSTPKLKYYVKNISQHSELEIILAKHMKDTENFLQKNNIYNLYFACSNAKDKFSTIQTIMSLLNKSKPTEALVRKKLEEIERKTKEKFDNCQVRYNKKVMKFKKNSLG